MCGARMRVRIQCVCMCVCMSARVCVCVCVFKRILANVTSWLAMLSFLSFLFSLLVVSYLGRAELGGRRGWIGR